MEYRIRGTDLTVDTRDNHKICGYINVTERESEILYNKTKGKWFKEVIKKGAFERALDEAFNIEQRDIPLLLEHNYDKQLATTADGTFELKEDQIGLKFEATVTDEELLQQVRNREIKSCSFGFLPREENIEEINTRLEKRFVQTLSLFECSLVKNPAYVGSLVEERALQDALEADEKAEEIREKTCEKNSESSEKNNDEEKDIEDELDEEDDEEDTRECGTKKKDTRECGSKEKDPKEDTRECGAKKESEKREMDIDTQGSLTIDKEEIRRIVREVIAESEQRAEQCEEIAECHEENQKFHEECATESADEALFNRTKALSYKYRILKLKKFEQSI